VFAGPDGRWKMLAAGYAEAKREGVIMLFETDQREPATADWRFVDLVLTDGRHNMNVRKKKRKNEKLYKNSQKIVLKMTKKSKKNQNLKNSNIKKKFTKMPKMY
jgi:hypothetical protein